MQVSVARLKARESTFRTAERRLLVARAMSLSPGTVGGRAGLQHLKDPSQAKAMKELNNLGMFATAVAFAAEKHRRQRRKDSEASPYINHPITLARLLIVEGDVDDIDTVCGAVLHDTIEDTDTTYEELCAVFGESIASIVLEVTDDKSIAKEERKAAQVRHAPSLSRGAKLVKLADKIANLLDILQRPPAHWSRERKSAYLAWAAAVVDGLRGVHPALEARFDEVLAEGRATLA